MNSTTEVNKDSSTGAETSEQPDVCGALGCTNTDRIEFVDDGDGRTRALCPRCAKRFLGDSS